MFWPQVNGTPVSCRNKLKLLSENHIELAQLMQKVFEDAILLGMDESAMRDMLLDMVYMLDSPKI